MNQTELILASKARQTTAADNAIYTLTIAAVAGARHFLLGLLANYSAAPAAGFKTVTVSFGGVEQFSTEWDASSGIPLNLPLPAVLAAKHGEAVVITLDASGTGGVTGKVVAFVATG